MASKDVVELSEDNFQEEVLDFEEKILVDFWATWCGPCKKQAPIIEEVAAEFSDVKVGKVNVDDHQNLAAEYGIMSIPTLILFENGEVANKQVGLMNKDQLKKLING
jgi:thioredoxin 1